jgi:glycosyltransferase involved in cell wall biosynthesis
MRQSFSKLFKIDINKIIVAHPTINTAPFVRNKIRIFDFKNDFIFFYPSLSRVFKNHEVICKASEILIKQKISNFKVIFTIAGNENQYSRYIYNSFKHLKNIVFMESQSWENTLNLCSAADCVIFPSKLETWGIPITEAKLFMKPILLADLEYAHETLGKYDKARFFNPENHKQLSDLMKAMIDGTIVYEKTESRVISEPFSRDWNELFNILLK